MGKRKLPQNLQDWVEARGRFRLTHAQVQMARELGFNPRTLGSLANHDQEPWKLPLAEYIAHLYFKRFRREQPEIVRSLEERQRMMEAKKAAKKAKKAERKQSATGDGPS